MTESIKFYQVTMLHLPSYTSQAGKLRHFVTRNCIRRKLLERKHSWSLLNYKWAPKPCGKVIDIPAIYACKSNSWQLSIAQDHRLALCFRVTSQRDPNTYTSRWYLSRIGYRLKTSKILAETSVPSVLVVLAMYRGYNKPLWFRVYSVRHYVIPGTCSLHVYATFLSRLRILWVADTDIL